MTRAVETNSSTSLKESFYEVLAEFFFAISSSSSISLNFFHVKVTFVCTSIDQMSKYLLSDFLFSVATSQFSSKVIAKTTDKQKMNSPVDWLTLRSGLATVLRIVIEKCCLFAFFITNLFRVSAVCCNRRADHLSILSYVLSWFPPSFNSWNAGMKNVDTRDINS